MLLGKRKVQFVVSASKGESVATESGELDCLTLFCFSAKLLQPLLKVPNGSDDKKVEVEILTRSKDEAENKKLFEQIIQTIGEGVRRASLPADSAPCSRAMPRRTRSAYSQRTG